jgi:2,4-dienoyl-CoA reductase (NADPH2)
VTLFDAHERIGGQFNVAMRIPGKEEFTETIRYFGRKLELTGVQLRLGQRVTREELIAAGYDDVIVATGVTVRMPRIEGIDHPKVLSYLDVLRGGAAVGKRVAIIGAGGIGFDVAEYLLHDEAENDAPSDDDAVARFHAEWGVDTSADAAGGLRPPQSPQRLREVTLLQRKPEKPGRTLGLSTGWAVRAQL